ncbi:unnamed protein product [Phyllotreta striolata]|uniref:Putative alpha-L-fucosidase n=1 Tax=Phyllotreta striolata TaxID=444603 RepID=A0A9N9TS44_PHYSR|nr:unnamed protein product [Phyllotreta striolata]
MTPIAVLSIFALCFSGSLGKYQPDWKSLDTRPLPQWFDDAKIGIFLHWGVFSVPSFGSEWFWNNWKGKSEKYVAYMKQNYPKTFTYQDFAKDFTAEFFDPDEWAKIFANSGAKYIVLTSKHHEGFTLWPSKYAYSWNSADVGPARDLVGELSKAVRSRNLTFGVYHSLYEWFNPIYLSDKQTNYTKREFVENKIIPEMVELIEKYRPSVLWSDGDWEAYDSYWKSTEFLAWLYNDSPVKDEIVTNDRWGIDIPCHHGDFYSCKDRYNPGTLQKHKWENAMTIDKQSWGFRRNAKLSDYYTIEELIKELVSTVSCGGNLLMNVGPTKEGIIAPIFQDRLSQMGEWLKINGEAIYGTKPWFYQNDTLANDVWYTGKGQAFYIIALNWPKDNILVVKSPLKYFRSVDTAVTLLGNENDGILKWTVDQSAVNIKFPDLATVRSKWAYVLKITFH